MNKKIIAFISVVILMMFIPIAANAINYKQLKLRYLSPDDEKPIANFSICFFYQDKYDWEVVYKTTDNDGYIVFDVPLNGGKNSQSKSFDFAFSDSDYNDIVRSFQTNISTMGAMGMRGESMLSEGRIMYRIASGKSNVNLEMCKVGNVLKEISGNYERYSVNGSKVIITVVNKK